MNTGSFPPFISSPFKLGLLWGFLYDLPDFFNSILPCNIRVTFCLENEPPYSLPYTDIFLSLRSFIFLDMVVAFGNPLGYISEISLMNFWTSLCMKILGSER